MSTNIQSVTSVHQGKWGFYPCSKEVYEKLKMLNKHYERAVHMAAAWHRWNNKAPQNRVIRRNIKDDKGRKIKSEVVGPAPMPQVLAAMTEIILVPEFKGSYYHVPAYDKLVWTCVDISAEYKKARYPKSSTDQVKPLSITEEKIDSLLAVVNQ